MLLLSADQLYDTQIQSIQRTCRYKLLRWIYWNKTNGFGRVSILISLFDSIEKIVLGWFGLFCTIECHD